MKLTHLIGSGRPLFTATERQTFLEYAIAREMARLNLEAVDRACAAIAADRLEKVA